MYVVKNDKVKLRVGNNESVLKRGTNGMIT